MVHELPVQASPIPVTPVQVSPEQVSPEQVPLAQVPPIQAPSAGLLKKKASKSVTPAKETVTPDKDVNSEEVPSSTQVFNSPFVNEIKDPCIDKAHQKNRLVIQAYNDNKNLELTQLPKIQRVSQDIT